MAHALARPEDILVAYDPDTVSVGNQAAPLEVHGGRNAFREMTGGADSYHEDFTSGLRDFVAARQAAGRFDSTTGGSTLVGGWFGGAGADPSALVMGLDWLAKDGDDGGLLSHVVGTDADDSVNEPQGAGDLSAFILSTSDGARPADGLEAALAESEEPAPRVAARSDNLPSDTAESILPEETEQPRRQVADLGEMMRDVKPVEPPAEAPDPSMLDLGTVVTDTPPRTQAADPVEDGFVVIHAAKESVGAGQPPWDLDLGTTGPVSTLGAGGRKRGE